MWPTGWPSASCPDPHVKTTTGASASSSTASARADRSFSLPNRMRCLDIKVSDGSAVRSGPPIRSLLYPVIPNGPWLLIHRKGSPGGGAGAGDLRLPQADEPKTGGGDVVSMGIPEVTGPAQMDDRLDDLHDQGRDEDLVQTGGRGGRTAEPPVYRLQLRPLRAERRK